MSKPTPQPKRPEIPGRSAKRREQRRRAALALGGNSVADDRQQLIGQMRAARAKRAADSADTTAGERRRLANGARIVWLAQLVAIGPKLKVLGYDSDRGAPDWLAELIDTEATGA